MTAFESPAQGPPQEKSAFIDPEAWDSAPGATRYAGSRRPRRRRREIRRLSDRELATIRGAFTSLYEQSPDRAGGYWQLCEVYGRRRWGTELEGNFLAWHRALLLHFEALLVQYDSSIDLPYWDWSDLEIPAAFLEGQGENPLFSGPLPDGRGTERKPNPTTGDDLVGPVDVFEFWQFDELMHRRHTAARLLVGGDMETASAAPYDPLFWSLTANIDRLWAEWQAREPGK